MKVTFSKHTKLKPGTGSAGRGSAGSTRTRETEPRLESSHRVTGVRAAETGSACFSLSRVACPCARGLHLHNNYILLHVVRRTCRYTITVNFEIREIMIFTPREAKPSLNTCYHSYDSFYRHIIHYRVPPGPHPLAVGASEEVLVAARYSGVGRTPLGEFLLTTRHLRRAGGAGRGVPGRPAGSGLRTLTVTRAARERRRGLAPVPRGSAGAGAGVATLRLTRRPGRPGRRGSAGVGRL